MKRRENNSALTLMEILVSLSILALVLVGLMNVFLAGRRYMYTNRSKMEGGELGKYFLDSRKTDVDQSTWGANCVGSNVGCPADSPADLGTPVDRDYRATYTSNAGPAPTTVRRITVNITWPREQ